MTYLTIISFIQICSFLLGLALIKINEDLSFNLIIITISLSLMLLAAYLIEIIKFFIN